ncbi:hypothetical protein [Pseudomonas sp. NA-150]|uniref:hypothetical protein n=1 Tax=Pseudomonas sp. NA-150 TaxID=3367525 RepID=UPI0037CB8740
MLKESLNAMNPVTVIALFAALCEGSAATALPFLADENQDIYVWFLISFPTALTLLFFLTLNFNHKVLYAPSDFSNEKNFLKAFKKSTIELKSNAHADPSDAAQLGHLRPLPKLLLPPDKKIDVFYGGFISSRHDIEHLISILDLCETAEKPTSKHRARLILLLKKQNKHDEELISPLRRRSIETAYAEIFAILATDSSDVIVL